MYSTVKRIFDVVVSGTVLLILFPLLIALGVAVTVTSPGGPLYRQVRVGIQGRPFTILKFRTMYARKQDEAPLITRSDDVRITPLGGWMRRNKLDELPQFVNVLRGDMSIVGPRPEVSRYVDLYTAEQRRVLSVRPGITDLASVTYRHESDLLTTVEDPDRLYMDTILPEKLTLGLKYVDHKSLGLDLRIIIKTAAILILALD
jgi:lipopolysaccharide/colanic/teichoic acid biosynthesis glycosyltransferase